MITIPTKPEHKIGDIVIYEGRQRKIIHAWQNDYGWFYGLKNNIYPKKELDPIPEWELEKIS